MLTKLIDLVLPPLCLICQLEALSKLSVCADCWASLPLYSNHARDHSAFYYQSPIDFFITQLKFHEQVLYAHWLGKWFIETYQGPLPQAILPVPLHVERLRERGFNQALQIARPIAQHFKLPLLPNAVIRHKNTRPQTELSPKARKKNLKNAFILQDSISYDRIAIFDDVITTGSTVEALKACLGDIKIDVWSVARVG